MKKLFTFLACLGLMSAADANNIQITNISVTQPNITFEIKWDNSWNTTTNINPVYPTNWDGAWVFIKYQNNIDNLWKHATVSTVISDHTITGGILEINTVTDGMGVFIRRTAAGAGNLATTTVTLKMNSLVGTGSFNFKVFGTEVVHIPTGTFQLGDGNVSGVNYFNVQDITAAKQSSGISTNGLYSGSPAVPAAFPMGYNAYYMMKYEITNEQWVDFLNTLTYDQQVARMDAVPNAAANSFAYNNNPNTMVDGVIKIQSSGLNNTAPATLGCDLNANNLYNEAADGQNLPVGILSKADLFSFLDWSGLRPMTELEYEKAARGTQARVLGEFAWGTTEFSPHTRAQVTNGGLATEVWGGAVTNGQVTAGTGPGNTGGPTRSGMYATNTTGRATSGAGFYGNMDLCGNMWEISVGVDAGGVVFTGNNGNGTLTALGEADAAGWPGNYNAVAANGTTIRGGSYYESGVGYNVGMTISYRPGSIGTGRLTTYGGRGVRTAP